MKRHFIFVEEWFDFFSIWKELEREREMFLVGLTGGIASGKSTVSSIFAKEYGIPIIDADAISRKVVEKGKRGWHRVRKAFGDEILNADHTINRDRLGDIIFSNHEKRKLLNKCLHDLIALEILKEILFYLVEGHAFVILDVPLLFEVKFALRFITYKIVVDCSNEQVQLSRLMSRNRQLSESDALARIHSQMANADRLKLADHVIDNSKDIDYTRKQVARVYQVLRSSRKHYRIRIAISVALSILFGGFIYFLRRIL